jgi:1A family penicillin-binding protein
MSRLREIEKSYWFRFLAFGGDLLRFGRNLLTVIGLVGAGMLVVLGVLVLQQLQRVPDLGFLANYHPVDAIEIYDKNDHLICAINKEEAHKNVDLAHISKYMQEAVLAAEDHHFYEHHGINYPSIVRALYVNFLAGHVVEGGSTISQQLVKNMFFTDSGRTIVRKIAEAIVAEQLEGRYSKQDILTMYLNEIYFGNGAHGIEPAALIYFGKSAASLTLPQAAFLAAVIKAPSVNGSLEHRAEALARQHEILDAMAEYGFISQAQAESAKQAPLNFELSKNREGSPPFTKYPYYVSYVLSLVHKQLDENQIRNAGLRVYTNLDPVAQSIAEELLAREIKIAPKGIDEEALVSIKLGDGAVTAIVGGAGDYWKNQWNSATNVHTVGSAFKPFVYLTAFLGGVLDQNSILNDEPLTVSQIDMTYMPKNYDGKYMGKVSVRKALAMSRNTCAVRVAQKVGVSNIITTAQRLGITSKLEPNLAIALGSCAASPLELASAYGTIARGGIVIDPWVIRHIDDLNAKVLARYKPIPYRIFEVAPVAALVDIMQDVVLSGSGTQAKLPDRPAAGKTGTADQARDLWFIGFTPDMVTAVWGGSRDNKPIAGAHITGGSVMARVWKEFNVAYYKKTPTPPGELIAVHGKDVTMPAEPPPPAQASPEQVEEATMRYIMQHRASGSSPANAQKLQGGHGITEYAWSR